MLRRNVKSIAALLLFLFLYQIIFPAAVYALSGGPSQPEVQSFEPIGTTQMVDVSSGDFVYNIPLLDVDGYPINLSYHSGITTDQEASWVGLGWNINPGVINRNMRGLPDDFKGDQVEKELNIRPNKTIGLSAGMSHNEVFGFKVKNDGNGIGLKGSLGIYYNNYKGWGSEFSIAPTASIAKINGETGLQEGLGLNGSIGLSSSTTSGATLSPEVGLFSGSGPKDDLSHNISVGAAFNSREGLKALTISGSTEQRFKKGGDANNLEKSGAWSFARSTYVPQINTSMSNYSLTFSATVGSAIMGFHGASGNARGYYTKQVQKNEHTTSNAFGFFYAQDGADNVDALHDFNREKDGPYTKNTPSLPLTNYTYDVYGVSGQGIGGVYKPFRGDIGMVYDNESKNTGLSGSLGGEFGVGNVAHNGFDVEVSYSHSNSGMWTEGHDNLAKKDLKFKHKASGSLYEPFYFKSQGEKTVDPDNYYAKVSGSDPLYVGLKSGYKKGATNKYFYAPVKGSKAITAMPINKVMRKHRDARNEGISYLTADEASVAGVGLESTIKSYAMNQPLQTALITTITRNTGPRKAHHLSEITAYREDGSRYVYGIAAYNNEQHEVSFNASQLPHNGTDDGLGLIEYNTGEKGDNTNKNTRGVDYYYSKVKTPGYAHSYLLTDVLSPDYADVDGVEGPSPGDNGTYTKINYTRVHSDYKWRVPIEKDKASFNEMYKTDFSDDKASYIYGGKEYWYVHSIESKNYVAEFTFNDETTEKRHDSYGVADENGGRGTQRLRYLKKITLYSRQDLMSNPEDPTPIKTVYFEYDYSLASKIPNNDGLPEQPFGSDAVDLNAGKGKLTLKKIYFTYGKSEKGRLSSYQFEYNAANPDYNLKGYDRWGNYKLNSDVSGALPTADYPYVAQDSTTANANAAAWSLTDIKLPSGGRIHVDYEADDYAYVQDKRAMNMFQVIGTGDSPTTLQTWDELIDDNNVNRDYIYFKLPHDISAITDGEANSYLENEVIRDIEESYLYFRFFMALGRNRTNYEYVSGYTKIEDFGMIRETTGSPNTYRYGYLKLKKEPIGDNEEGTTLVNPISKIGWQYTRLHLPKLAYGDEAATAKFGEDESDDLKAQQISQLRGHWDNMVMLFKGFNRVMRSHEQGKKINLSRSWVRLYNPDKRKFGGGVRVKQLTIKDEWHTMGSSGSNFSYAQRFSYSELETMSDGFKRRVSTGVASYEPMIGGDENPFRMPDAFSEKNVGAPDDRNYLELPYGESFFPSPSVVYSKVRVTNVTPDNYTTPSLSTKGTRTGYTIHEFYTARDFPTITRRSTVQKKPFRSDPILKFLNLVNDDFMTASQGYTIELNDMHGKPKAEKVFSDKQEQSISGMEYYYQVQPDDPNALNNQVQIIDKYGKVEMKNVGIDVDLISDARESRSETWSGGVKANLDAFITGILPIPVPMILPSLSRERTQFHSMVVTKVVNRYGILQSTVAYQDNARIRTENLAYDSETGQCILTKISNEFDGNTYSFSYPAYWYYDGMGPAYRNLRFSLDNVTVENGAAAVIYPWNYFVPGDELLISNGTGSKKAWVLNVSPNMHLIDEKGNIIGDGNYNITVIRSGRRNLQSTSIGSIASASNLIDPSTGKMDIKKERKILSASATEFKDHWQTYCNTAYEETCDCTPTGLNVKLEDFMNHLVSSGQLKTHTISTHTDRHPLVGNNDEINVITYSGTNTKTYNPDFPVELDILSGPIPYSGAGATAGSYYYGSGNAEARYHGELSGFRKLIGSIFMYQEHVACTTTNTITTCSPRYLLKETISFTIQSPSQNIEDITSFRNLEWSDVPQPGWCPSTRYTFTVEGKIGTGEGAFWTVLTGSCSWPMANCVKNSEILPLCRLQPGETVNPFLKGLKGNWRPFKAYTYLTERNKHGKVATDGDFKNFTPFWVWPAPTETNPFPKLTVDRTDWTWTSELTKVDPNGHEVENKDALGRYSAELLGYNNTLVKAAANNARYTQLANDNFEDYDYVNPPCVLEGHFNFAKSVEQEQAEITSPTANERHSGRSSIKVINGFAAVSERTFPSCSTTTGDAVGNNYSMGCDECIGRFEPTPGEYVVSAWIKGTTAQLKVELPGQTGDPLILSPTGPVIEGWQRVEGKFNLLNASGIKVSLIAGAVTSYFDDLRIHPFNSNMKTYVYDPLTLRLSAILDENNYATFYEYDEEGALTRVKKETKDGIFTIQESRTGKAK